MIHRWIACCLLVMIGLSLVGPVVAQEMPETPAEGTVFYHPAENSTAASLMESVFGPSWYALWEQEENTRSAETATLLSVISEFRSVFFSAVAFVGLFGMIGVIFDASQVGASISQQGKHWFPIRLLYSWGLLIPIGTSSVPLIFTIVLTTTYWTIGFGDHVSAKLTETLVNPINDQIVSQVADVSDDVAMNMLLSTSLNEYYVYINNRARSQPPMFHTTTPDPTGLSIEGSMEVDHFLWRSRVVRYNTPENEENQFGQRDNPGTRRRTDESLLALKNSTSTIGLYDHFGVLKLPCVDVEGISVDQDLCKRRRRAVARMYQEILPMAQAIAQISSPTDLRNNPDFYGRSGKVPLDMNVEQGDLEYYAIRSAKQAYRETMVDSQIIQLTEGELEDHFRQRINELTSRGWVGMGQYYWNMASLVSLNESIRELHPRYVPPDFDKMKNRMGADLDTFETVFQNVVQKREEDPVGIASWKNDSTFRELLNHFIYGAFGSDSSREVILQRMAHGDPIANLQVIGSKLISLGYHLLAGKIVSVAGADAVSNVEDSVLGEATNFATVGVTGLVTQFSASVIKQTGVFIIGLMIPVFILGLLLAIYVPAIPFLTYYAAVLDWFITVIEACLIGTVWAFGHGFPRGHGLAGNNAQQGYFIGLNLVLKPILIPTCFFVAILSYREVTNIAVRGFDYFTDSLLHGTTPGPLMFLGIIFLFGTIMIYTIQYFFDMVNWIPSKGIRWLGQRIVGMGNSKMEGKLANAQFVSFKNTFMGSL